MGASRFSNRSRGSGGPRRSRESDDRDEPRQMPESMGELVFVDIETGGLELRRPIMQIAALAVDESLDKVESFEVKIRFDESKACRESLRRVHYRRAEWQRAAVSAKKAAWAFASFLRRHAAVEQLGRDMRVFRVAQLVSHNSQFDGPFLRAWYERQGVFLPASFRVFCTLQRAYWYFAERPDLPVPDDYRLGTLCEYFDVGLHRFDSHEAMADVRAAVGIYRAMMGRDACQRPIESSPS